MVATTAAGTADTVTRTRVIAKSTQALSRLTDVIEEGKPDEAERFWREYMEKSGRVLASSGLGSRVIALHDA